MKNVNEIRLAVGSGIEAGAKIAADGKLGVDDFGHVFGVITKVSAAVEDAKKVFSELATSTNDDMNASDQIIKGQIQSFSEETLRDIAKIENGIFAVFRIIGRAKLEGIAEGRAAMLAEAEAAGMDVGFLKL